MSDTSAAARLAASWLLWYPDERLAERLPDIRAAVDALPAKPGDHLRAFLAAFDAMTWEEAQRHYVDTFDMRRRTAPYLSFWTDGDTRNRGFAILRFKQAYLSSGFEVGDEELPDHLSVVLEFAAVGNRLSGDALLIENRVGIGLLAEGLRTAGSHYAHLIEAVLETLPPLTPEIRTRMAELARTGPPAESVGLDPFPTHLNLESLGGRR